MHNELVTDDKPGRIFILCLLYGLHMVEEFTCGFVPWADRYFGKFDWTQNLIGNLAFFVLLALGCHLYRRNPQKYLWAGMAGCMWVLANVFIHVAATLLGHEYSPGVVTAVLLYLPGGLYFLRRWFQQGVLTWTNLAVSFAVGAMLFMLLPTFGRAMALHAQLAKVFHLVR